MKKVLLSILLIFTIYLSFSQTVGIGTNTPDSSAILDITHTSKGLLIPRMNTADVFSIVSPAKGLIVYDSTANQLMVNLGSGAAANWQPLIPGNIAWRLSGNTGTNPASQFIGTTDNQPLLFRINNIQVGSLQPSNGNISWGIRAGQSNTSGFSNIAIGTDALKLNTFRTNIVAIGDSALFNNGDAIFNTAVGSKALFTNTTGSSNTAIGFETLEFTTTGSINTAVGTRALNHNTSGRFNTGTGFSTLFFNTSGEANTATGNQALLNSTTSNDNTATGSETLKMNITGSLNTATGSQSIFNNTTGAENTATGAQSLNGNTLGNDNAAFGFKSIVANTTGSHNTALGALSLAANNIGSSNTAVGFGADVSQGDLTNATAIGQGAIVDASNKVRIGNSAVTVIEGQVPFTTPSDGRFKFGIRDDVKGLNFIMLLHPVTYRFDVKRFEEQQKNSQGELFSEAAYNEASAIRRSGFIAQEVEKAAITSGYNFSGIIRPKTARDHYSLSYESFVVPLVKAVQEQQEQIRELREESESAKEIITKLLKELEEIKARLR